MSTDQDKYPIEDWRDEVAAGDTKLGYAEWREHQIEMERDEGEASHTPGPWSCSHIANFHDEYSIYSEMDPAGKNVVNTVYGEANARLIAEAPEMLEALEMAIDDYDIKDPLILEVVAKAKKGGGQ